MKSKQLGPIYPLIVFFALLSVVPCFSAQVRYAVTDIGTFLPQGINNNGQICGQAYESLMIWDHGTLQSYSTAGLGEGDLYVNQINNLGQVVGNKGSVSWIFKNGGLQNLNLPNKQSWVYGINDQEELVGSTPDETQTISLPALFKNNNIQILSGSPGTYGGWASDINNRGQIAGYLYDDGHLKGYFWYQGSPIPLGTLGGVECWIFGMNEEGQLAGVSGIDENVGDNHAFFWEKSQMIDLGTLGGTFSDARGINNFGQVVGSSTLVALDNGTSHAFLWKDGTIEDLNGIIDPASGWVLEHAVGINDSGYIIGYGHLNEEERSFLLTPIPEPSSFLILGVLFIETTNFQNT